MKKISPHQRKKNPEQVKKALVLSAMEIGFQSGVAKVTLALVAQKAGVTKGAIFHHYKNKHELMMAMFQHIVDQFDLSVNEFMEKDDVAYGSFTRAYVNASLSMDTKEIGLWDSIASNLGNEKRPNLFNEWIKDRMKKHSKTDSDAALEVVRLASDGACLFIIKGAPYFDVKKLRKKLLEMTYK